MSRILRFCSSCKHYPRDEHCKECIYKFTTHDNTGWEPKDEFINKPCVSEQACHEDKMKVLSKIRAEIETEKNAGCHTQYAGGLDFALSIIDKHMKESEDT